MTTTVNERVARAALGALLMIGGFVFVLPLKVPAFFFGMMLLGIAVDVRGTEFPEDETAPSISQKAVKAKAQKKATKRKAAS